METIRKEDAANAILHCLQSAFDADPSAMQAMITNRVPCNTKLADHPHVIVDECPVIAEGNPRTQVTALGLLNGVLVAAGLFPIAAKFSEETDDDGRRKLLGFCFYKRKLERALL